ncbi:hypothetical protein [Kozakia baliensis]|uniref:Uncharacterized protein n=1 Tax=Kozakia baliensis TaxID=153496 RepID=A0A1D8UY77_9PROT|nr:hypothetical protein [Kozakia baliensis]AOX18658.1 hypothetical protein A0U89_15220 [Kozakia baliensis]GEL65489.1 hypothetical protein KBA01_27750 [Kozakia baliensis]
MLPTPVQTSSTIPLTRAALAIGRLDQRLQNHPLRSAILFRERLEAARACAAVDGHLIDPWHLAADLEGLKPRIIGENAYERGSVIDAAKMAFDQYLWLTRPTREQATRLENALAALHEAATPSGPLLGAAQAFHRWIDAGGDRSSMRGALVRFWQESGVLQCPLPLVAARAFAGEAPWKPDRWIPLFLSCLADEAEVIERRTIALEQAWRVARAQTRGQRRTSRARTALDLIAAFPVISASRLSALLSVSLKAAYLYLERFLADGLVVEVTHRSARRLFALTGLEPLREAVTPPRRPLPGRKRGRPRCEAVEAGAFSVVDLAPPSDPSPSLEPIDYAALEEALAAADAAIARFRKVIE